MIEPKLYKKKKHWMVLYTKFSVFVLIRNPKWPSSENIFTIGLCAKINEKIIRNTELD